MLRGRLSRLLLIGALLVLSACQAEATVNLDVEASGAGTVTVDVTIDEEADAALGGFVERLRISDLERAGWDVVQDETATTATVTATKRVPSADQWQPVLDEIAGPGVFNDVEVSALEDFASARQEISFTLDLSDGWGLFSDEGVAAALDGEPFGAPIEELTGGRSIDDIVALTINATVANHGDDTELTGTWTPRFDSEDPVPIEVSTTSENSLSILLRWIAIALASLFVLATILAITGIVLQRRSDRLRPEPQRTSLASRVPGVETAMPTAASSAATGGDTVRLVVLEPLAVLFQQSRPVDDAVLPFVRGNGGTARADAILQAHDAVLSGSMETAAFWELCGLEGDTDAIDSAFIEMRVLHPGAAEFLAEMQRRRIPVAATTNDAEAWSMPVRERDRLSAVWPWLASSTVGTRTSNGAMFEVLRRESGVAHAHCLYVDSNLESLDAAKELGMRTALFNADNLDLPKVIGHPIVKDFKGLFG